MEIAVANCIHCGTDFVAPRRGMKYCSRTCCDRYWSKKEQVKKAERSRLYGQKRFGWKPKPTEEIACAAPNCQVVFVPQTNWGRCCSVRCGNRLRYKENPEKHREKTNLQRLKHVDAMRARGRATWAEMKTQRGIFSRYAKSRQPWLPLMTGARHRSLKSGLPFDLTREWCEARWTGRCELTGIEFSLNTPKRDSFAPSIDKIDPAKGYVQSNCRFVLWAFNLFKYTGTDETMYSLARTLVESKADETINSILSLPC